MSSIIHISGAAWRYARALADLAAEQGAESAVSGDLQALDAALREVPELARFVRSPLHATARQQAVLGALAERMELHALTRRFLSVLAENRRLALLGEAIAAWAQLQAQARGQVSVQAVTAAPLSDAQRRKLEAGLKKALGHAVDIDNAVDEDILGGLVLRIGSRMIDASVRQRLNALKGALKGV